MEVWQEIAQLREKIDYHSKRYYDMDSPEISDFEYDALMRRLKTLEEEFPLLAVGDSPTRRVGGAVSDDFKKVAHKYPMQSLTDVFNESELRAFLIKITETNKDVEFVVERKIDGLSVALEYVEGEYVRASTRGDGQTGEDVTENVRTIQSVPARIREKVAFLEVRGEIYMPVSSFLELNEKAEIYDQKTFANPRNAAAGSLRQLNSQITAQRKLDYFIFNVQGIEGKVFSSHSESLEWLSEQGFCVSPEYKTCRTVDEVWKVIEEIGDLRGTLDYGIDGAVVKVNSLSQRLDLGTTSKVPKWAVAYKYPPEQKETQIEKILVQVGRTGKLTPLAQLTPVKIAGSTVARATLHNEDFIIEKDIREGDTALIQKAGDIIPEVVRIILEKRPVSSQPFKMPANCPVCGASVVRDNDESASRCTGTQCPAQLLRHLVHFVSKDAMNIEGLGPSILEILLEKGLIRGVADIYTLHEKRAELLDLERFGEKSVNNLLDSIEKTKQNSLERLITALGIRNVGVRAAFILAEHYRSMDQLMNTDMDELLTLEEFGEISAKSVLEFFLQPQTKDLINSLKCSGVQMENKSNGNIKSEKFAGLTFVLTGTLPNMTRDAATAIILSHKGKVSGSVSKNTSYVVAGDEAGSKLDKANLLGVTVLDETEFLKLANG